MITQKGILTIGIGILILLSDAQLMASDEDVTLQSEDENPEQEEPIGTYRRNPLNSISAPTLG